MFQYPLRASGIVKNGAPLSFGSTSSSVGVKWYGLCVALLRYFGSKHNRNFPFDLVTHTHEFTQSVWAINLCYGVLSGESGEFVFDGFA